MARSLPSGTVTFLFTDVEGSTKLLHQLGAERYADALGEHRRVLREAFAAHGGVEVDTQGDAFFVAFATAPGALAAAEQAGRALAGGPIRVRIGIHTGTPHLTDEGYVGADVNRAARIAAAGHGGQVLVSAATATLVEADGLRDLGEHRLKDLSAPERVYQLGDGAFPPLKSLHQTNLPIPATPFLGRERELHEVTALLAREDVRLLTLTGPGGTGKTRLGLQAAADVVDRFADGVWWVPLAPLRESQLVIETAARALGASDGLVDHVGDKSLLLLLDNFEHVVDAAPDVAEVLVACPNLEIVVTSREVLHVPGEHAYPVPSLAPDEGTALFVARARAARPSFEPTDATSELCARLDNLPLALELAAARARILSTEQLLERLSQRLDLLKGGRGVDPRQQTLRATIEWSYELCSPGEQELFGRLSVFRGGCSLEAAEGVCDADLDTLQSLVDKSLARVREDDRFWMLETIREYAVERLDVSGEADELRRRHAEYFLAFAETAYPNLRGTPKEWVDRLERERDNMRAALDWFETSGELQRALQLAGALWKFWSIKGDVLEGRRRLEAVLGADERPTLDRARALNGVTAMVVDEDSAAAREWGEEALALSRTLGDEPGVANSTFLLGVAANSAGEFAAAHPLLEDALTRFRELADDHYTMLTIFHLAWAYGELGETERARALDEENLERARAAGNERIEAHSLDSLAGYLILEDGSSEDAIPMLQRALRIYRDVGEAAKLPDSLSRIARAHLVAGRPETAARLLASSLARFEEAGTTVPLYMQWRHEEMLAAIRAQLDQGAFARAWEHGQALTLDEAIEIALDASP